MSGHPFVVILDDEPIDGHMFGNLKMRRGETRIVIERRCHLCNRLPIELLTIDHNSMPCKGGSISSWPESAAFQ